MAGPSSPSEETKPQASPFGEGVPPLPENATPEEKDAHWFKHVYRGDKMPQLTLRAVVMGGLLGMLMAASNLYTTLSIGWGFGVAITACVMSYVIWNLMRLISGGSISKMSVLENNCMASTASAAGYSTGSTIATMFGAILLLAMPEPGKTNADVSNWSVQPVWVVTAFTFCTGLMGVFLAIPMKRQMINHEQLRFPSGVAAAETLRNLFGESAAAVKRAYVLIAGICAGAIIGIINTGEGTLAFLDRFFSKVAIRIPESVMNSVYMVSGKVPNGIGVDLSVLLIAAGVITRMRVCMSMLLGSIILYFAVGPALVQLDQQSGKSGWREVTTMVDGKSSTQWEYDIREREKGYVQNIDVNIKSQYSELNKDVVVEARAKDPGAFANNATNLTLWNGTVLKFTTWSLWGGTAIMVFASLTSVALQWKTIARAFGGASKKTSPSTISIAQKSIEVPNMWMIAGMIPIGIAMVIVQMIGFHIHWWAGVIAVLMSFVLSMVGARATGETDTTPIGAMGKVMQLLFAGLVPGNTNANLASAGVAANSAASCADLLTDLKAGYLLGANPRKQFIAQFVGVFFGTLAIVPAWYLMVPNKEALEKFSAPATRQWEAVAKVLTKGIDQLPDSAKIAILIGAFIGIVLPIIERYTPAKYRQWLPSAMGLGLSWVIPFSNAIGFAIGAVIGLIWEKADKKSSDEYSISLASGLIAGESLIKAIIAMTATAVGLLAAKGTP